MIKAIIFDFDGVIVDTENDRFKFFQKELSKHKIKFEAKYKKDFFGRKSQEAFKDMLPDVSSDLIKDIIIKRREFLDTNIISMPIIKDVKTLIKGIDKKYKIALASGSEEKIVKKFLQYHDLLKYFDVLTTGEYLTTGKPDPECYLITLKKLKIKPSEALIIEDAKAGIIAGQRAGCKVLGLKNKYNKEQIKLADKVFNNHKEILKYLENIN